MHIQGPRGSRRGGWQSLDTGSLLWSQSNAYRPTPSGMALAHYHRSATYLLPHVLLRGCVARICGETCMISPEVQQDLYGYIGMAFGVRGEVGISQLRSAEMHAPTQLCLFHVWCLCGCALLWVVLERSSVSGLRPLLPSRSPEGDLRSDP